MYDRKTWVVLALCGGLLAANIYYSSKNNERLQVERDRLEKLQKDAAPAAGATPPAQLTVEAPPAPATEETVTLESKEVIFTLTNIGGGIKFAEFKNQFQTGNKKTLVQVNQYRTGPIGTLAGTGETLDNIPYAYEADKSIPGKKAVFTAKLSSGLIATKTFSLNEGSEAGAPYLLNFDLQLTSAATTPINLNQWSVFMGEATPNNPAEVSQYTGFLWHNGKSMTFKAASSFKGGTFSAAKQRQTSPSDESILYAGVTNQFFATVLRPKEPAISSVWGKTRQVPLSGTTTESPSVFAGLQLPSVNLDPNQSKTLSYLIFIGPKHNPMLLKMNDQWGDNWGDMIDYGWFCGCHARSTGP